MRIHTLAYLSIAALVHGDAAWGQEKGTDEVDRWIPSFGMSIGIIRQTASGSQQNNLRPPDDGIAENGREAPGTSISGDDSLVDPLSVFAAELMSPGIGAIPGHPRLFLHGEVGGAFGSVVQLAREGSPGEFALPAFLAPDTPGLAVGGQGTKTELEISTLMAGAGAGIAFTLPELFGRRLRLKPSFEYLRHGVEAEGVMRHVSGNTPDEFVFITLQREKERTLHSIGGGLELELDTLRLGPFVIALFANGQAYELLGERDIHLFATDGTNTATWDVTLDREIYRGSAGLRFRFFPEE